MAPPSRSIYRAGLEYRRGPAWEAGDTNPRFQVIPNDCVTVTTDHVYCSKFPFHHRKIISNGALNLPGLLSLSCGGFFGPPPPFKGKIDVGMMGNHLFISVFIPILWCSQTGDYPPDLWMITNANESCSHWTIKKVVHSPCSLTSVRLSLSPCPPIWSSKQVETSWGSSTFLHISIVAWVFGPLPLLD
jgi:hypothetical protein